MRSSILAGILALALPACLVGTGDITGPGGDPGNPGGSGSGSDNGSGSGSDNGSGSGSNNTPTPMLSASLDMANVATELGLTSTVNLVLTTSGGFTGPVNIMPTLVDTSGTAITAVNVSSAAQANITADGTQMVPITIQVPINASGTKLTGTLKVDVTSSLAPANLTAAVTVDNVFTVVYADGTGNTISKHPYPSLLASSVSVKKGAIVRWKQLDTTPSIQHITHGDGVWTHETISTTTGLYGDVFDEPTTNIAVGGNGNMGCHDSGSSTYAKFSVE